MKPETESSRRKWGRKLLLKHLHISENKDLGFTLEHECHPHLVKQEKKFNLHWVWSLRHEFSI